MPKRLRSASACSMSSTGALDDNPHVQRLASRETWVYGGVYVEQRVTGLQAGGHRALHFVHGFGKPEFGLGMGILEPGTAVVQAGVEGRSAPVFLGECAHAGDVLLGGPSSVSAVTVDLIKGGGEQHRCPGSGCHIDRRLEHGVGVRANSEQRDRGISVLKFLDSLDEALDNRFFHGVLLLLRNYSVDF